MTWFAIIALDHIFILLIIIIHPRCYLYLHKVFIHCPCPLLLCGKIHFHRWKVNVLFLWAFKQLSQLFVLICSSVHPLDPFSHPFCCYLFSGDSGSLQRTHKVSENTWLLNVGHFWRFFVQFFEHWSNSIKSSYVGQTPIQLVKVPYNRRVED